MLNFELYNPVNYVFGKGQIEKLTNLVPSNTKLMNIWGKKLENVAFYVRRKNYLYPELESYRRRQELMKTNTECPICFENENLSLRYNCSHRFCNTCFQSCLEYSINYCSLCRQF